MATRIRILFVNPYADVSGPENVVLRLLNGLDKDRFVATLVCPREGRLTKAARQLGLDVSLVPLENNVFSANPLRLVQQIYASGRAVLQLTSLIKLGKYDLVHINSHRIGPACTLAARMARVPILWHIHEIYQTTSTRRRVIVELVRRLPDAVVAVSNAVASQFAPCSKLSLIYNGIDPTAYLAWADREAVRAEFNIGPENVVVGCMGRLSAQKGQDVLLKAARIVVSDHPNVRFLVVGDEALGEPGFRTRLEALASELGLTGRVIFTGYRSDSATVLAATDIFVHPAMIPDALPTVILEAMALGKPVVATATGGSPELIEEGRTGLLAQAGDVSSLAESINNLLVAPSLANQFGEAGRRRVYEKFSLQNYIQKFEILYQQLASNVQADRQ